MIKEEIRKRHTEHEGEEKEMRREEKRKK